MLTGATDTRQITVAKIVFILDIKGEGTTLVVCIILCIEATEMCTCAPDVRLARVRAMNGCRASGENCLQSI